MSDSSSNTDGIEDPEAVAFWTKLREIFTLFLDKNQPAKTVTDADTFLTTDEVWDQLQSIYPSDYSSENVYELMTGAEFKIEVIGGDGDPWYWLIKKKERQPSS